MREITRKVGEAILLGDDIQITILDIEGTEARIGVRDLRGRLGLPEQSRAPADGDASDPYRHAPLISGDLLTGN